MGEAEYMGEQQHNVDGQICEQSGAMQMYAMQPTSFLPRLFGWDALFKHVPIAMTPLCHNMRMQLPCPLAMMAAAIVEEIVGAPKQV